MMNIRTHLDTPSLPLLRRASTLIAMGTVGLALVAAAPTNAEDSKPQPKTTTTTTTTTTIDQGRSAGDAAYRRRATLEPRSSEL